MRVLVLSDGITPFVTGGMQRHTSNLVKNLVKRGHKVELLHCVGVGNELPKHEEVANSLQLDADDFSSRCFYFPSMGVLPGHYLKESYAYSEKLYDYVKKRVTEFDLIYAKGFCAWKFIELKRKKVLLPPIGVKFHGYEMFQKLDGWKQKFKGWMLRGAVKWNTVNADLVFSYGGKITEIIKSLGVLSDKIVEVPSGIDDTWILKDVPQREGKVKFLFIGRYERRKGIQELHQILSKERCINNAEFHFVGNIPHSVRFSHPNVSYHGEVKDVERIKQIMDASDVLLVPSHSEGMPNVILEGMSRGMSVIATDVGAVSALVDSRNGKLIPPLNTEELELAIEKFALMTRDELTMLGKASLHHLNSGFGWERIAEKIENELNSRHLDRQ